MQIELTALEGVKILTPKRIEDARGFFSEVYSKKTLESAGLSLDFVQDNHSLSVDVGTIRGLHYQSAPFAQDKLVRVTRGRILDIAVDIRRTSASFGQHVSVELSQKNGRQLLVPVGFAHGFVTLEADTEVIYKVTNYYSPSNDHGLAFDDPQLGINWGIDLAKAILSDKDRRHPRLADATILFD